MKFHYRWECRFQTMDLLRRSQGASLLTLAVWCCPNRKCRFYCINRSCVKLVRSRVKWAGPGRRIISREVLHPAQKTRSAIASTQREQLCGEEQVMQVGRFSRIMLVVHLRKSNECISLILFTCGESPHNSRRSQRSRSLA